MTACPQTVTDYSLLAETPAMYSRPRVAKFIEQEVSRPSKQWISSIIDGKQEADEVVCRTDAFVLLPDTERVNRYWRIASNCNPRNTPPPRLQKRVLNWLAIAHDRRLRTMRDLRGEHLPMLKTLMETCMRTIEAETGIRREQVMAYVHYPPSVYQLHVHFSYPFGQYCHRDAYRVHNLATIIDNLEIDPDYYAKATLQMAIYRQSLHFAALTGPEKEPCTDNGPVSSQNPPA
jgi:m7GpppX diphosphatase